MKRRTLLGGLGGLLLAGCAAQTPVDFSPKTVSVDFQVSPSADFFVMHADEIKEKVADFYKQYGIIISYNSPNAIKKIKLHALTAKEFRKQHKLIETDNLFEGYPYTTQSGQYDLLTNTIIVRPPFPYKRHTHSRGFGETRTLKYDLATHKQKFVWVAEQEAIEHSWQNVAHELGHAFCLGHPEATNDKKFLQKNNLMLSYAFKGKPYLHPEQVQHMHDCL